MGLKMLSGKNILRDMQPDKHHVVLIDDDKEQRLAIIEKRIRAEAKALRKKFPHVGERVRAAKADKILKDK